jgi:hypothetical protein
VCGLLALFAVWSPFVCCYFHAHKEAAVLCAAGVCGLLALFAVWSPFVCCYFYAHKEAAVLCAAGVGGFVFCLFWHCTLVHFVLFSSLNLMMRSSPSRSRKKSL